MANFTPKTSVQTIRNFLLENCICTEETLDLYWNQFVKEGEFCSAQEAVTCDTTPTSIFTVNPKTIEYDGESVETEDYDQETADGDSLCSILGNTTLSQLCEAESRQDECNSGLRFVVASSTDNCLKEFSQNYYREKCTVFTGCGTYSREGYRSRLRSGPISAGEFDSDKELSRIVLEASHSVQATPSQFSLSIGRHSQAVDPNFDDCGIVWSDEDPKDIECLGEVSAATHRAENTLPSGTYDWPMYYTGGYVYFELTVINPDSSPVDTGGATCLSWISLYMRQIEVNY
jgi:hypothetical protein